MNVNTEVNELVIAMSSCICIGHLLVKNKGNKVYYVFENILFLKVFLISNPEIFLYIKGCELALKQTK